MDAQDVSNFWDNLDLSQFDSSQDLKEMLGIDDLDLTFEKSDADSKLGGGDDSPCGSPLPSPQQATPAFSLEDPDPLQATFNALLDQQGSVDIDDPRDLMFIANQMDIANNTQTHATTTITIVPSDVIKSEDIPQEWLADYAILDHKALILKNEPPSPGATVTSTTSYIRDNELMALSVKDLNRRLQSMPKDEVKVLKQRRRTLKNRGYAAHSRERRQKCRSELESDNQTLMQELKAMQNEMQRANHTIAQTKAQMKRIQTERDHYKGECERLKEQQVPTSPMFQF